MNTILILKSLNQRKLTNELINSWLFENEMFIINKNFSDDQYTVEITFVDEERTDMINDFLTTCFSDFISISRPQIFNDSFEDDEREPSPVHLSSAMSISSRMTCFSQRLAELNKNKTENKTKISIGRGRGIEINSIEIDRSIIKQKSNEQENSIDNHRVKSTIDSLNDINLLSSLGRGRGSIFK